MKKLFFLNDEKLIKQSMNDCWKQCWRKLNDNWKIDEINKNKTNVARRNWHNRTIEIDRKIDVEID